jgi:hypothetical protein
MSQLSSKATGMLAAFESPAALMRAAAKMRDGGYTHFDCHSPFPIHGMDRAMGLKRSPLGFIVGAVAFCALTGISLMMWWMSAVDYPLVISGKPYFSFLAYVPPAFAITILSSALTALFGMLILNRLPQLFHPGFLSVWQHRIPSLTLMQPGSFWRASVAVISRWWRQNEQSGITETRRQVNDCHFCGRLDRWLFPGRAQGTAADSSQSEYVQAAKVQGTIAE